MSSDDMTPIDALLSEVISFIFFNIKYISKNDYLKNK